MSSSRLPHMAEVFRIPEILVNICAFLFHDDSHRGLSALASLARSSSFLSGFALNVLWGWLPSLVPLILAMPPDLWKVDHVVGDWPGDRVNLITFVRPPMPNDFARFTVYASRVRILGGYPPTFNRLDSYRVAPSVMRALSASHLPCLLPSLHTLEWSYMQFKASDGLPCIQVLYGYKLKKFKLVPPDTVTREDLVSSLTSLKTSCPCLEDLALIFRHVIMDKEVLHHLISETVGTLRHLRHFECRMATISVPVLLRLADLPALESIHADASVVSESDEEFWTSFENDHLEKFKTLQSLHLRLRTLPMFLKLLMSIHSPYLANVSAWVLEAPSGESVEEFFRNLVAHRCHDALRTIKLRVDAMDGPTYVVSRSTFENSIMKLPNIESLNIDIDCPFDIDDDLLFDMCAAWHQLKKFSLGIERPWQTKPKVTLYGLRTLCQLCPDVQELGLHLDTRLNAAHLDLEERPGAGGYCVMVDHIDVGHSKIMDPVPIAAALSDIFPYLEEIDTAWPHEDDGTRDWKEEDYEMRRRWERVQNLVLYFSNARAQERNWRELTEGSPSL